MKRIPKQILAITRFEDDTFQFTFSGLRSRSEVKTLLNLCDREVRLRLSKGQPLDRVQPDEKEKK